MDVAKMMKQAQQMQKQMLEAQKRVEAFEVEGISGGGMVSIVLTGAHKMKSISVNNSLLEDKEADVLEDLILAAYNDAWEKVQQKTKEEMGEVLPNGQSLPFL